jgi:hypothetical protein
MLVCERDYYWGKGCLHPVTRGGETDTLGSVLEREDFTGVNPGDGCPGKTVDSDKDVRQGDDSLGGSSFNSPG